MNIQEYFLAIRRQWLVILLLGFLGGTLGFGVAKMTAPTFTSTSSVFVSATSGDSTSELVQGSNFTQNLMQSYAQLASMPVVLDPVIRDLKLDITATELSQRISVNAPLNTVLIKIRANAGSAQDAASLADALANELSVQVQRLAPKDAIGNPAIRMDLVARASIPQFQSAPNTKLIAAAGLALGLFAGVVIALFRALLDTRIRTENDIERITTQVILGKVPRQDRRASRVIMRTDPSSIHAESYRRVASNLEFISPDDPIKSVVITSALPGEGKSTVAINLALALAENDKRVLVIDGDLRRPSIGNICGFDGQVGLTTVLTGHVELKDAVLNWGSISVLPAGRIPPNPTELLKSRSMSEVIKFTETKYDYVIIDSAPLLPVSDSLALSRQVSGTVVVARASSTKAKHVISSLQYLEAVNAPLAGIVLNRSRADITSEKYSYSSPEASARKTAFRDTKADPNNFGQQENRNVPVTR